MCGKDWTYSIDVDEEVMSRIELVTMRRQDVRKKMEKQTFYLLYVLEDDKIFIFDQRLTDYSFLVSHGDTASTLIVRNKLRPFSIEKPSDNLKNVVACRMEDKYFESDLNMGNHNPRIFDSDGLEISVSLLVLSTRKMIYQDFGLTAVMGVMAPL